MDAWTDGRTDTWTDILPVLQVISGETMSNNRNKKTRLPCHWGGTTFNQKCRTFGCSHVKSGRPKWPYVAVLKYIGRFSCSSLHRNNHSYSIKWQKVNSTKLFH